MSKSLGNVLLVRELVKAIPGEVLRLALLSAHYRQPLDWTDETVTSARRMLDRFYGAIRGVELTAPERATAEPPAPVVEALEDDLNTPKALAEMFSLARQLNKATGDSERRALAGRLLASGDLLGLLYEDPEAWFAGSDDGDLSAAEIDALLKERESARAGRDFSRADAIREQLSAAGIQIEDGADGTRWRRG
jgi:cysteinyl-tRNA synthetase